MRRWRRRRRRRQRTSGTYPERLLRRALKAEGVAFQENPRVLGMCPDIVLPELRVAVFVDGCFWHGCPKHFKVPEKNPAFWSAKIGRNKARDERQGVKLIAAGWAVVRLWEHEIRSSATRCAARVLEVCAGREVVVVVADPPATARSPRKARPAAKSGTRTPRTARTKSASRSDGDPTPTSTAAPNGRRKRAAPKPKKSAAAAGTKPRPGSHAATTSRSAARDRGRAPVSPSTSRKRAGAGSGRG